MIRGIRLHPRYASINPIFISTLLQFCSDRGKEFTYSRHNSSGAGMITSKLTSKAQTAIPGPVQSALRLRKGDELVYTIEGDRVFLKKDDRGAIDEPFASFGEWASEADGEDYASL